MYEGLVEESLTGERQELFLYLGDYKKERFDWGGSGGKEAWGEETPPREMVGVGISTVKFG